MIGKVPYTKTQRTRTSLVELRSSLKTTAAQPRQLSFFRRLCEAIKSILDDVLLPLTMRRSQSMCKYYGHVFRVQDWKGHLPKCSDCGQQISDSKSLRKSEL